MNKLKLLAGQTLIYGVSTVAVRALNWLLAPFHSQVFDANPQDYGIIAEMYAYIAFINVILMYGMETAFFRYATKRKEDAHKVFSTAFLSLLVTTLVFLFAIVASAHNIASLLGYPEKHQLITIVAIILGFDTLSNIPFAKLRLEGKSLTYVGIKGFNVAVNIVLNIALLYPILAGNPDMFGYSLNPSLSVLYVFVANLAASVLTFMVFLPNIISSKIEFCLQTWRDMMRYGMPLIIVGLAGMVNETIDRILLKIYLPFDTLAERMAQVGIYAMAYKLSIFMSLVVQGFRLGAEPFFFKQAEDTDAKVTYAKVMSYFVIVATFIFLGVSVNLDWIILILSETFRAGKYIVPIVLMAYLFLGIFYNLSVWYKITDNTMKATYIAVLGAMVTVLMNVLLIPKIGFYASAWATLGAYFIMTIISAIWGRKYYPIPYEIGKISAYLILGLGLYIVHYQLSISNFWLNIVVANTLLLIYVGVAYYFDLRKLMNSTKQPT